ncbi:uncharacterized protein LOC129570678 [Sitodiplosis mosellana]|uniref:uncharacterized protein LOC129570678 n=1 Tax=Sitodiplosis mosellana TaxID=263140 RepID=UPI00244499F3|nr:uncharacterized protein LOC129570678 [Sitodiplosis mosellana]
MDQTQCQDEVLKLIGVIEPHTIASLARIREHLRCSGLELDQCKQQFLDQMNDWMTRVFDRLQSQSESQENDATNYREEVDIDQREIGMDKEEVDTEEVNSKHVETEFRCPQDEKATDESNCAPNIAANEVVKGQILGEEIQSTEEKLSEEIYQSMVEVGVVMKSDYRVIDEIVDNCSNRSSLDEVPAFTTASIDTINALESISTIDSINALEELRPENSSTNPSGEVVTIGQSDTDVPIQMPDLLMNLAPAMEPITMSQEPVTKSQEDSLTLKRKSSNEIIDETMAKKLKQDDNTGHDTAVNQMMYGCAHCLEAAELQLSVKEVHQHWQTVHSAELKPFQFYVVAKARCFYCDFVASFGDIAKHHQVQHSFEPFAVVNMNDDSTCGICASQKSDLIEHFNNEHESIAQSDISNPILLDDNMLIKLLAYNSNRYQCANCDRVFETQLEVEFHHTIEHVDHEMAMRIVDQTLEPYLICDYCQAKVIDRDKYLNHIEEHCYVFKCSKCDFQTEKMIELVGHDKKEHRSNSLNFHCLQFCELLKKHFANTKVIFPNGLLLFNHQLTGTKFGNGQILFDLFIEELIDIIRQKYKSEHGTNDKIDDGNEHETMAAEKTGIPKVKRPPISARAFNMKELRAQNRLINNLCIYGIPYFENENKNAIFLNMCSLLQANVSQRDIVKITRAPGWNALLIVELKQFEVKQRILHCAYMKPLWSSDLIHLPVEVPRKRVFVNIHTTKFYGRMAKIAKNAMRNNTLHIFWITRYGFLVKRTKNSQDKIVLSPDELVDYIKQRTKSTINREKQFYRSIAWVSTSNGDSANGKLGTLVRP